MTIFSYLLLFYSLHRTFYQLIKYEHTIIKNLNKPKKREGEIHKYSRYAVKNELQFRVNSKIK